MTGLEFIRKCEEHDFVELFINFYSADELKRQAEELGIELNDEVANTISAHYEKFGFGNLSKEDREKFIQGLERIEL